MTRLQHLKLGGRCTYCDRRTQATYRKLSKVSATRDHVTPQSKGGRAWVLACRQCNELKGDLSPAQWRTFMQMHPRWWQSFATGAETKAAVRAIELHDATIAERWCAPIPADAQPEGSQP